METPNNSMDTIDSRDVMARYDELEAENTEVGALPDADFNELTLLRALVDAGDNFPDWEHGITLIRDSYFREYAQELAEEIGAINPEARWPLGCIDWDQATRELQMDYTAVEFDGITYWGRA